MLTQLTRLIPPQFQALVRYAIVGVAGTAVDVLTLFVLHDWAGVRVLPASAVAFVLAVIHNYLLNKVWTFQIKESHHRKFFLKFLSVALVGLALTLALMYLFVHVFQWHHILSKLLTSALVVLWNFSANKYWTFRIQKRAIRTTRDQSVDLSVIIPAYKETQRLPATLADVLAWVQAPDQAQQTIEIIVVDDGSGDDTAAVARTALSGYAHATVVSLPHNQGKGAAVAHGMALGHGGHLLFMDADNSTPLRDLSKLLPYATDHDIVIGSRHANRAQITVEQSPLRQRIGRLGNQLIQLMVLDGIDDTQCGFKLFSFEAAQQIFPRQKIHRWGFDIEALSIGRMLGYRIAEVPVTWAHCDGGQFSPLRDTVRTLLELVYIKLNIWTQRYH